MTDILMPALSPTMEEGTLAKWLVKEGDEVKAGDVIAEIETDKATMEVEAVDEGVVERIVVPAGTEGVKVNALIAVLKGEGETLAPAKPVTPPQSAAPTAPPPAGEQRPVSPPSQSGGGGREAVGGGANPVAKADGARVFASPLARRLAQQAGIDIKTVVGSGPHGRIIKVDVEAAKAKGPSISAAPAAREAKSLEQLGIPAGSYDLVPLDGMRKTIARRLTEAARDIPHFPLNIDIEIDALLAARGRINKMLEKTGVKVSVNDIVIKAAAMALKQVPEANASFTPEGIALHHNADIAVAVAVDGGLITPIIRKAELKTLSQIAVEMKDLAERARSKKLKPEEFQGGTFSVSNLGMFGIKSFSSIINEPQGAILSVGAGEQRPVVKNGQLAVATVMTVTLTCDHRVVDGAIGAKFLSVFKPMLEDPATMLA